MKFKFISKALVLEPGRQKQKILVIADLHIGYEEALNEDGILVPRGLFKETVSDLRKIFQSIGRVDKIIVLGDLKHEFGTISQQEWREVLDVLDFLKKWLRKKGEIVLIKGNHDTILGPIARRKELIIRDFYVIDGMCFLHGHKLFLECLDKKIKMIVLGHRHPAVVLFDKYKKERYKCFLIGRWKNKETVILPSFFPFFEGGDVVNYGNEMFIPEKKLREFDVFVIEPGGDKVYRFGKMKSLI